MLASTMSSLSSLKNSLEHPLLTNGQSDSAHLGDYLLPRGSAASISGYLGVSPPVGHRASTPISLFPSASYHGGLVSESIMGAMTEGLPSSTEQKGSFLSSITSVIMNMSNSSLVEVLRRASATSNLSEGGGREGAKESAREGGEFKYEPADPVDPNHYMLRLSSKSNAKLIERQCETFFDRANNSFRHLSLPLNRSTSPTEIIDPRDTYFRLALAFTRFGVHFAKTGPLTMLAAFTIFLCIFANICSIIFLEKNDYFLETVPLRKAAIIGSCCILAVSCFEPGIFALVRFRQPEFLQKNSKIKSEWAQLKQRFRHLRNKSSLQFGVAV